MVANKAAFRPRRPRQGRVDFFPVALVSPLLLVEVAFVLIPLAIGFYYSLNRVDFFQLTEFVGWGNYLDVVLSADVQTALLVTTVFAFVSLIVTFVIGFALAMYLDRNSRFSVLLRAVVLVPHVISLLVGSLLLKWVFAQDAGILPVLLQPFGLADLSILADPARAMGALIFNGVWRNAAFAMVLLMAGLKSIPAQLHFAARVDGASGLYRFRRITLPLMRVPILITLVRLLLHYVNVLTYQLVLTAGGPGTATRTISLQLYRLGFEGYRFGQANALAFLMVVFNLILIAALASFFRRRGTL